MADSLDELRALVSGVKTNPLDDFNLASAPSKSKLVELDLITQQRVNALKALSAAKIKDADSWSSQLGVRNTPVVGTAVDLASSFVSGTSRQIGNLVNLPNTAMNFVDEIQMTDEDKLALLRFNNNTASAEDKKRIFRANDNGTSIASRYLDIQERNKDSKDNAEYWDTTQIVNQTDRAAFDNEILSGFNNAKESFDKGDVVTGIGKLIYGAGKSILTNPKAVAEYMAENAPQLIVGGGMGAAGKVVLTATNIGYAADEYRKGVQKYMQENGGALPPDELRNSMALKSAALAVAEHVGELGQLSAIKKVGTTSAAETAAKIAKEKAGSFLKTVAKATGTGALEEGLTEAFQTSLESSIQGEVASVSDIYKAGVIGAASGGGLSGGGSALNKGAESLSNLVSKGAQEDSNSEAVKAAIVSGDTTAILDPKSPDYAPHRLVDVAIGKAVAGEVTSEEKQATYQQLDSIQKDLTQQKADLEAAVIPVSDNAKAAAQESLTVAQEQLQTLESKAELIRSKLVEKGLTEEDVNTKIETLFGEQFSNEKAQIQSAEAVLNKQAITPEESAQGIKKIDEQLAYMSKRRNELGSLYSQVSAQDITALVSEVADTQVDTNNTQAVAETSAKVSKILTFAMQNTNNLSQEDADKLSKSSSVTPTQKAFLEAHVEAKRIENGVKDIPLVSAEIFQGSDQNKGIDTYRRELSSAFTEGSKEKASGLYKQLINFAVGHKSKLTAIEEARALPGVSHVFRESSGNWVVLRDDKKLDTKAFDEARKAGTVLSISKNGSTKLYAAVQAEVQALRTFAIEAKAGIKATFDSAVSTTTTSVNGAVDAAQTATQEVTQTNSETGIESQNTVTAAKTTETNEATNQANTPTIKGLENGTQTTETKQTETQGQEQQQGQANVTTPSTNNIVEGTPTTNTGFTTQVEEPLKITQAQYDAAIKFNKDSEANPDSYIEVSDSVREIGKLLYEGGSYTITDATGNTSQDLSTEQAKEDNKPKNDGKLSTFDLDPKNITPQEAVDSRKLLAKFIKQVGGSLPLLQTKDFLSQWIADDSLLGKFLKDKTPLTENQTYALGKLKEELPRWNKVLDSLILVPEMKSELEKLKNIVGELVNADGSLDENILTAISLAAHLYVIISGASTPNRDFDDTAKMLGISQDVLWKENYDLLNDLAEAITTENAARIEMGRIIGDILGLKNLDDNTPDDILPRLKASLGAYALELLKHSEIGLMTELKYSRGNKAVGTVITFPKNEKGFKSLPVEALIKTFASTEGILENAFGTEAESPVMPTTTPTKFTQKTTQKTQNGIPNVLAESAERDNNSPKRVDQAMSAVIDAIGKDTLLTIAGSQLNSVNKLSAMKREGAEAKHNGLASEFDLAQQAMEEVQDEKNTPLFLRDFFTKTVVLGIQRLAIKTRGLNPMTSKIHRNMFYSPAWNTVIDGTDQDLINVLKSSIATGLGINPDTNSQDTVLQMLDDILQDKDSAVSKAVVLLEKVMYPENAKDSSVFDSAENKAILIEATAKENMMGLKALTSLAALIHHERDGFKEPLTVNHMVGVDGKVNGTALAHVSYGTDDLDIVGPQTGFYSLPEKGKKGIKNFVEYSLNAGLDLYQNTISGVIQTMWKTPKSFARKYEDYPVDTHYKKMRDAVSIITGNLGNYQTKVIEKAGRDMVKEPITALHFGSSIFSVKRSASAGFIDTFSKLVAKRFEMYGEGSKNYSSTKDKEETKKIVDALNTILQSVKNSHVDTLVTATTLKDLLELKLDVSTVAALREGFEDTVGEHLGIEFNIKFADYLKKRDAIVRASAVTFAMYMTLKKQYTEQLIKEDIESGLMASITSKQGKALPAYALSARQNRKLNARLRNAFPRVNTVLSKRENNIDAGLVLTKGKVGLNDSAEYSSQIYLPNPEGGNPIKTALPSEGYREQAPGVSPTSATVHSTESAIMQLARSHYEGALNINDELGVGVHQAREATTMINKYTAELLAEYNPLVEILDTTTKTLGLFVYEGITPDTMDAFHSNLDEQTQKAFSKFLENYVTKNPEKNIQAGVSAFIVDSVNTLKSQAISGELAKHTFLSTLAYVDQYPMEGSQYTVPEEFREAAKEKMSLSHLNPLIDKTTNTLKSLQAKADKFPQKGSDKNSTVAEVTEEVLPEDAEDVENTSDDFDRASLESMIKDNSISKALELLSSTHSSELFALVEEMKSQLPDNLEIKFIGLAEASFIESKPEGDVNGWFTTNSETSSNEIYLIRERLTEESFLHEVMHAGLSNAIEQAKTGKHKHATALVNELTNLMASVSSAKGNEKFKAAFENVHEFVTWGLTNKDFQQFLKGIESKSNNKGNWYVTTKLKDLFDMVFSFFLGNRVNDTAYQTLLINAFTLTEFSKTLPKEDRIGTNLSLGMAKQNINSYSSEDIYEALATPKHGFSASFDIHLRNLLGGMVNALKGPFGSIAARDMQNPSVTPLNVWNKTISTNKAPLVSNLSKSGVTMTQQERFVAQQVEAMIQDAMTNPETRVSAAMQELIKLFNTAKSTLKPENFYKGNWAKASPQSKRKAENLYNFIFNEKAANGNSTYLSNFVALGLANEKVNQALSVYVAAPVKKDIIGATIAETLMNIFEFFMNLYMDLATKTTEGMQMNTRLYALTERIVAIERSKKEVLKRDLDSKLDPALDALGKAVSTRLRSSFAKLLKNKVFSKNRYATVRFAAAGARVVLEDRLPAFAQMMVKLRDDFNTEKHGLAMNLMNDVKGYGKRISAFIRMATAINAEREHIATQLGKTVMEGFIDGGTYLTKDDHAAISGGLLRTGAYVLLGNHSLTEVADLLENETKLNGEISTIEKELISRFSDAAYYFIKQSKGLGAMLVMGNSLNQDGQLTNAMMISKELTGRPSKLTEAEQKEAEIMIDELSTLYAFKYRGGETYADNASLAALVRKEITQGEKTNGIYEVMKLHEQLYLDSKELLFSGSELLMRKGYLPEITNPHTSFEFGTLDPDVVRDYANRGYETPINLVKDSDDTVSPQQAMFVLRDGAPSAWVSGGVQLDSNKAKGTAVVGLSRNLNSQEGRMNASDLAEISNKKLRQVRSSYTSASLAWEPGLNTNENALVPLFDQNGKIVNWRYEMVHAYRDSLLERDNQVGKLIGAMAGTTFGKETAAKQNKAIIESLHQDYTRNFGLNRNSFIYVSGTSTDTDLTEIWRVLPYQFKQDLREVTGDAKGMWVRKEYLLPVFGYRKYSLSEIWTKQEKLVVYEQAFKTGVEYMLTAYARTKGMSVSDSEDYAKRAYIYVRRGQRAWEEVVSLVKDVVVIRTGTVMMGNIISNFSLLKANGVSLRDIGRTTHVAIKAYKQWDENSNELFRLETEQKLGFTRGDAAVKGGRIKQLKDMLNNSPIKKLIDAGLRPSIVEDLSQNDDEYSYKSDFVSEMDKYADKINPTVRTVANELLMNKNSFLYKKFSKVTQMSDFVARYTLYQHLINRKDNPMTEQDAIFETSEAFINYDVPMAKGLQFVDDMGFTPFIKYFFRIQRVLLKTAKEHPMQVLGLVALNHFQSSLPLVTDSSFVSHIGNNPFRSGAGQIFSVWDDTLVLDQLSKLVK